MLTACEFKSSVLFWWVLLLAYTSRTRWFVLGQIFASVALNRLNASDPMDFRTPIYSQVRALSIEVKVKRYTYDY
jgi:hypothetical protein